MVLPFTIDQFLGVFAEYNTAIWPMQILLNLMGIAAVALVLWRKGSSRTIPALLAFLWAWSGVVYHMTFFSAINPAAMVFGSLFVVQAILLVVDGVIFGKLQFGFQSGVRCWTGAGLMLYAMIVYPVLGHMLGHQYPSSPTFGAPCPLTIFTFGILLWTVKRVEWYVIILPFLWSLVGFTAAFKLGIVEDVGLLVAGVIATGIILAGTRAARVPDESAS